MAPKITKVNKAQESVLRKVKAAGSTGLHSSTINHRTRKYLLRAELLRPHTRYPGYCYLTPAGLSIIKRIIRREKFGLGGHHGKL